MSGDESEELGARLTRSVRFLRAAKVALRFFLGRTHALELSGPEDALLTVQEGVHSAVCLFAAAELLYPLADPAYPKNVKGLQQACTQSRTVLSTFSQMAFRWCDVAGTPAQDRTILRGGRDTESAQMIRR